MLCCQSQMIIQGGLKVLDIFLYSTESQVTEGREYGFGDEYALNVLIIWYTTNNNLIWTKVLFNLIKN